MTFSMAVPERLRSAAVSRPSDAGEQLAFRQLRHQTKNALQRLMCEIARNAESYPSDEGRRAFADMERRIFLTARVSDALFGLTELPGPLDMRLRRLCDATIGLLAPSSQTVDHDVRFEGVCPPDLADVVLKVAHEMICNAMKHGLRDRASGRVTIRVIAMRPRVLLQVLDDGAGPSTPGSPEGEGFALMRELAQSAGGTVSLRRERNLTVAELALPIGSSRLAGFAR